MWKHISCPSSRNSHHTSSPPPNSLASESIEAAPGSTDENTDKKSTASTQRKKLVAYSKQLRIVTASRLRQLFDKSKQKEIPDHQPQSFKSFKYQDVTDIALPDGGSQMLGALNTHKRENSDISGEPHRSGPNFFKVGSQADEKLKHWMWFGPLATIEEEYEGKFPYNKRLSAPFECGDVADPVVEYAESSGAEENNMARRRPGVSGDEGEREQHDSPKNDHGLRRSFNLDEKDWDDETARIWERAKHQDKIFQVHVQNVSMDLERTLLRRDTVTGSPDEIEMLSSKEDIGTDKPRASVARGKGRWARIKERVWLSRKDRI